MPFCPKCKYEYKEGFSVCSDCGIALVGSLDNIKVAIMTRDEATVIEARDFLEKNDCEHLEIRESSEEPGMFDLLAPEYNAKEMIGMLNIYYREIHTATPEEQAAAIEAARNAERNPGRYVDSLDRAENYKSGAVVLIALGIIGIVVLVLINLGIIPISLPSSSKVLIDLVMGTMFVLFVGLGVNSNITYKKLKKLASDEDDLEAKIDDWVNNSLDINLITAADAESDTEEIMFFNRTERLGQLLDENFPELEPSFKEHVLEDIYDGLFGCE